MTDDKESKKNRIRINFATSEVEIESHTEPLSVVFHVADTIAQKLGKAALIDESGDERVRKVGVG